jgi:hypothetical protein
MNILGIGFLASPGLHDFKQGLHDSKHGQYEVDMSARLRTAMAELM